LSGQLNELDFNGYAGQGLASHLDGLSWAVTYMALVVIYGAIHGLVVSQSSQVLALPGVFLAVFLVIGTSRDDRLAPRVPAVCKLPIGRCAGRCAGEGEAMRDDVSRHTRRYRPVGTGWSLLLAALLASSPTATVSAASASPPEIDLAEDLSTASVVVDGVELFPVRGIAAFPAARRAERIAARIEAAARDPAIDANAVKVEESEFGSRIRAGDREIGTVLDADAEIVRVDRRTLASAYAGRVAEAIEAYRHDRTRDYLVPSAGYALASALAAAAFLWLLGRAMRRIQAGLERRTMSKLARLESHSRSFVRATALWRAVLGLHHAIWALAAVAAVLICLQFILQRFPWTRLFGRQLLSLVVDPVRAMGEGIIAAIPGLVFVAVLVVVAHYTLKSIRLFFAGLAQGTITLNGFDQEWAWPTYRLVRIVVVVFAAVVAYPYIPGSQTDAFKGLSIFLGVVLSLGSTSTIGNIVAGYSLVYRRAFRLGDRIRISDHVGDVTATRLLVTHLRTDKNEEVIIPNSHIVNSSVVNYSTLAREGRLLLHASVGIGYETPWRQVEAMLCMAAERTMGVLKSPPPFVLQTALGDFAVTYELNVSCDNAPAMLALYSDLRRNILDVFNEYGIQIMTPAYLGDPVQPKLVPRERWYAAPAVRPAAAAGLSPPGPPRG
jgi:small-conductance mechanosensitive channel